MKFYLCEPIHQKAYDLLAANGEIIADEARVAECDAILNRNLHIDRAWMERCPNLKVIGIHGTGTDGVDLASAKELGIKVIYVPFENADSVAELIITFALCMSRRIPQIDRALHKGERLTNGGGGLQGMELRGKTFGMIGCGDIAMRAAKRLELGFGMRLAGYSPSLTPETAAQKGIAFCPSIEAVLEQADVINIGVRLTPATRGLVGAEQLTHAKPTAILINTARGGVVDEDALYTALKNGTLGAAACDVFAQEPPTLDNPLLTLDNFLATPHIGGATEDALYRVGYSCASQMIKVLLGQEDETIRWAK